MNDNEIIRDLEYLAEALGEVPEITDNEKISNIWAAYQSAEEKLFNYKRYVRIDSEETSTINADLEQLKEEKEKVDTLVSNIEKAIASNAEQYETDSRLLNEYREEANRTDIDARQRANALMRIPQLEKALDEISKSREATNQKLAEAKAEQERQNKLVADKEKEIMELYNLLSDKIELDAQTLYFAYNFFSMNPKKQIEDTINDYKDGIIDEQVLNERLQNLKVLLNSGLYNIEEINEKVAEKRLHDIKAEIESQKKLIREKNNIDFLERQAASYDEKMQKEETEFFQRVYSFIKKDINAQLDHLAVHGEGIDRLKELESLYDSYRARIETNKRVLSSDLDKLIAKTGGERLVEKEGRQVPNYFPEEYLRILDVATVERVNRQVEEQVQQTVANLPATGETSEQEQVVEEIRREIVDNTAEAMEENKNNETALVPVSAPIEVVNTKELEPSKLDKIKEWFNKNWKRVTFSAASVALAVTMLCTSCCGGKKQSAEEPSNQVKVTIKEQLPSQEIRIPGLDFGDELPEQEPELDEAKQEVETNTVDPTKKPSKPKKKPEKTPKPEIDENPVVTPTVDPTETPTVTPTETPTVNPTDSPTIEEPDGRHTYKLKTEEKITEENDGVQKGNSAPADSSIPYGVGESMYNPVTRTNIDSEGTVTTQKEDGSYEIVKNGQEVNPIEDGVVELENPNFSPINAEEANNQIEETPPLDSQTVAEAVANGTITDDDAARYYAFFDEAFGEENSKGR